MDPETVPETKVFHHLQTEIGYKIRSSLQRESGGRQNRWGMQMVSTFSVWKFHLGILDYLSRNPERLPFEWNFR